MHLASNRTLTLALAAAFGLTSYGLAQDAPHSSHFDENGREIIHHRVNDQNNNSIFFAPTAGSTSALSSSNKLTYHSGGTVFSTPTVYLIFYGNWAQTNGTDNAAGVSLIQTFFQHLGGSPYFMINSHYVGSANAISGNVTYGGSKTVTGYPNGTTLSDATVQTVVQNAINGGFGPAGGDTNGLYFVLTSSDVNESSGFCTNYCGWHFNGTINSKNIKYGYVGNAARCITSCAAQSTSPNGNPGVDGMISVLAHETEEATTDADGNAWYAKSGNENGDDCAWTFGTTFKAPNGSYANATLNGVNYLIQRNVDMRSTGGEYCDLSHH